MPQYEVSDLARKYAPWSYSKAEAAEICPRQFQFKYLAKSGVAEKGSDAKVGIVAHEILEHRVTGTSRAEARKNALEKNPLMSDEMDMLRVLEENLEEFVVRFDRFCKAQNVVEVLREVKWGITDDYKATDFFAEDVYFRGVIDLGALTRDKTLFLLDHKSGEPKRPLSQDDKKRHQLQSYGVLAAPNMPTIEGVRAGVHYLLGKTPDERLQWTDFVPAYQLARAYAPWLYGRINECASSLAHDLFPARVAKKKTKDKGFPCYWCDYKKNCGEYQEKHGK